VLESLQVTKVIFDDGAVERVGQDTAHRITGTQLSALVGVTSPGSGLVYALNQVAISR